MFRSPTHRAAALAAVLLPFLAVACGPDNAGNPAAPASIGGPSFIATDEGAGNGLANFEHIEVCKFGSTADVTVNFTQLATGATSVTHSFSDGECRVLGNFDGTTVNGPADITASESNIQTGFQFDSLRTTVVGRNGATGSVSVSTTNSFSYLGADNDVGILVEFFNSAIPTTGGEGCTPGYWKQPQHFDSWVGYTQNQLFSSVFEDAFPGKTLLEVISNGGNTAGEALGRHTVAALLNAASGSGVSYDLTTAQVIAGFNAVWPGTKDQLNAQKAIFAGFNEQRCPLN